MKAYFIDRYGKQNGRMGDVPEPFWDHWASLKVEYERRLSA